MKKVLTIILCALLIGCSSGKSEEDYINITNRISNTGFEIYSFDDTSVNLSMNLDETNLHIVLLKGNNGVEGYSMSLGDDDIKGYYTVTDQHIGSVDIYGAKSCEYDFDKQEDIEACDISTKEFIYSVRDLHDQILDELELSESDLTNWANWYIDNH